MVFHSVVRTCQLGGPPDDAVLGATVHYRDPVTFSPGVEAATWSVGDLRDAPSPRLLKGRAILAYARSLDAYKRASGNLGRADALAPAIEALRLAETVNPTDVDLAELRMVLDRL